jgi:hypothetical protein
MSPSGEVYNHDCVRWYNSSDIQRNINRYYNIGDAFVFDSSLKLLKYDELNVLEIRTIDQAAIDRINAEYDYCFLRGSNYIHSSMDWENAVGVLERLRIPVIAFGIGAQAPAKGPLVLSEQTKRVLHLISDRSTSLGVRGAYTADVLWGLGIKNVRIVGCPTVFRHNDPDLRIDLPSLDTIRQVAFTLRREVDGSYAQDLTRYLAFQRESILQLAGRFDLEILAQGEIEEKKIVNGTPEQKVEAIEQLIQHNWLTGHDDEMLRIYRTKMFWSDVVAEIEAFLRKKQFVLGYRLHGNLLALASRIPSVYFTYDSRTTEFAETFQIPSYDVFSGREFRLEEYWDQSLFEKFNRAYYHRYREMQVFLSENGTDHKMVEHAARPPLKQVA